MTDWRGAVAVNSLTNHYSCLKWPITIASILTTCLAVILLLSFHSDSWFTYELIDISNTSPGPNTTHYSRILEYGSLGLWTQCAAQNSDSEIQCEPWTQNTRPISFNSIIILVSCALFLSNLTVFPSWGASILIIYNTNNRYTRQIAALISVLLILTLLLTLAAFIALLLTQMTPFYSTGTFILESNHLYFKVSVGYLYASLAGCLALICLLSVTGALLWKKIIDLRLKSKERELLSQISNEYQPGWHKTVIAPRTSIADIAPNEPPPYQFYRRD